MSSGPASRPALDDLGLAGVSEDQAEARARLALSRLETLAGTEVARHPGIFEEVHELLDGVLADLDGSGRPAPGAVPGPGSNRDPGPDSRPRSPSSSGPVGGDTSTAT